ncbi:uncharacterized protein LOC127595110 [Hippocampus zosterae]|uniref:uncharacterized protein LOC127595110 n=1 Tax=Hippocampus zosterae TaxID=109293 RepID=UPI00223DF024|nr:uncharacterized protein LOC127595110 [Hippocampus zosterae]
MGSNGAAGSGWRLEAEMKATPHCRVVEVTAEDEPQQLRQFTIEDLGSDDYARKRYIGRVQLSGLQDKGQKHQAVIILDWDDTILATSYLSSTGFTELTPDGAEQFRALDAQALRLLEKVIGFGTVFIVTNAASGWVQYSSRMYLPGVHELLNARGVQVISARSEFEEAHPGDYHRWKEEAFKKVGEQFPREPITNLVCIGDSNIEIDAAHTLSKQFSEPLVKTIKFKEHPKPEELVKQQQLVVARFEDIYLSMKAMTIRLERKSS